MILDVLTRTERIMLAKRVAIVVLITRRVPAYRICQLLSVSKSTVRRMRSAVQQGSYPQIQKVVRGGAKKAQERSLLKALVDLGFPHYASRNRAAWIREALTHNT